MSGTISSISIANTSGDVTIPFVFDAGYKGDALTQQIAKILNLPDVHGWSVIDEEEHLVMVHYASAADMNIYGQLRGVLVDIEVGAIVANSFGYTPTAIASELLEVDGNLAVKDQDGHTHVFPMNDVVIKRVFEGVVIRVIWHKGKCYRITHRRINPIRSRWGSSKSFISMYEEAGGPTAEQLFDTTKPYSSTCYDFLVVDPSLLVGTRQRVNCPYLVRLAQREMDIKRPIDEVAPGKPTFITTDTIGGVVSEPILHDPKLLSLEEANSHLKYGYYNGFEAGDIRQLTGEAVIIYRMVNDHIVDIVKVHSPSYEWRVNMRGNNPNINNQFYSLLNIVYTNIDTTDKWETLKQKLIMLPLYDEQSLKDLYAQNQCILTIPLGEVNQEDYDIRDSRIHLLWMNYVLSLPFSVQADALNILSNFRRDRNDLVTWLSGIESNTKDIEATELPERVKGLISSSRRLSRERVASGTNYSSKGSHMKLPVIIKSTLRNLIYKEKGPSLYNLIREMKEARKPAVPITEQPSIVESSPESPTELSQQNESPTEPLQHDDLTASTTTA
jgi:hypothetical protein